MSYEEYKRVRSEITADELEFNPTLAAGLDLMWDSIPAWEKPDYRY